MPQNKEANVLSHHGTLCHDMLYVTTIVASLLQTCTHYTVWNLAGYALHAMKLAPFLFFVGRET